MTQDDADDEGRVSGSFPAEVSDVVASGEEVPLSFRYGEGDVIAGKYRLVRLVGHGGMGDVWVAHNETLDIDIAIKLMHADAEAESGDASDRLLREARAAARLGHPAIVRVFDFGTTDFGESFIAMELLEGEDLATSLAHHGRLSATKAVRTLLPVAHALDVAHSKRIVHRDLKPENIFLTRVEGGKLQPKLVDFGIAKIDRGKNVRLTQKGTVLGSPAYMAPEQARGDDVDHRADIWSFCVVLYESLTGARPFVGKNDNAVLYAIVAHDPQPITALASGDDALWAILEKGFSKNPDKRWQSMHELGAALATWLLSQGISEDIAGASLEATWLASSSARGDALGTVPPPAGVAPQRSATTERPPVPARVSKQAVVAVALVLMSGAAAFVLAARRAPPAPERDARVAPAPPGLVSAAPESTSAVPAGSGLTLPAAAPVELSGSTEQIPTGVPSAPEPPVASPSHGRKTPAKAARPPVRVEPPKPKPAASSKPSLKDPFR